MFLIPILIITSIEIGVQIIAMFAVLIGSIVIEVTFTGFFVAARYSVVGTRCYVHMYLL